MNDGKQIPEIGTESSPPHSGMVASQTDADGYDWLDYEGENGTG